MQVRKLLIVAGAAALFVGTACELLVNHDLTLTDGAGAEGGPPTPDAAALCPYSTEPDAAPAGDDGDAGTDNTFVFAMRTLDIGVTPGGFDLDHKCTCQYNLPEDSCGRPATAPTGPWACDADGGVDDRAAFIFGQAIGGLAKRFVEQANHFPACGQRAILFGLADYNGRRNDSSVRLNSITSPGLFDPHDGGEDSGVDPGNCTPHNGAPMTLLPKWDGTDAWSAKPSEGVGGFPTGRVVNAVVKDYILIADSRAPGQPTNLEVVFSLFGSVDIRFRDSIVIARIRPTFADGGIIPLNANGDPVAPAQAFILEGTVSGRANANDMLRGAALADFDTHGTVICTIADLFDKYKPQICGYRDIAFDPADDSNKGKTCSGLSTTFSFVATRALIGRERDAEAPLPNPCRPEQLTCDDVGVTDAGTDAADASVDAADASVDAADGD